MSQRLDQASQQTKNLTSSWLKVQALEKEFGNKKEMLYLKVVAKK